ncbi:MAG: hypothetical protein Q7T10_06585 [Rhodoferax sp.]|uniref:hypothetical protein n=1 Tax=Rhodoferax sp. TaxID=50421 RepID=UPI002725E82F|nr:hypothetical protein [Rhodoferax sp.]MDO8448458.1 hypothetical protein [Rhodoferax sp.]
MFNAPIVEDNVTFLSGADHFMVKGESIEAKTVGLLKHWLRARFITLIIVNSIGSGRTQS